MLWVRLPYLADASRAATEGEGFALVAARGQDHVFALAQLLAQGLTGCKAAAWACGLVEQHMMVMTSNLDAAEPASQPRPKCEVARVGNYST